MMEVLILSAIYEFLRDIRLSNGHIAKFENLAALKSGVANVLGVDEYTVMCFDRIIMDIPWNILMQIVEER